MDEQDWSGRAGVPTVFNPAAFILGQSSPSAPPANTWDPLYCAEYGWRLPEWHPNPGTGSGIVRGPCETIPPPSVFGPSWALRYYPMMFQTNMIGSQVAYVGSVYQIAGTNPDLVSRLLQPQTSTWQSLSSALQIPGGSAVMFKRDQVLVSGGVATGQVANECNSTLITSATYYCDFGGNIPSWQQKASMNKPRLWHQLVALADGKVLAVGGTRGSGYGGTYPGVGAVPNDTDSCSPCWAVLEPEIYDPADNTWTLMNPMKYPRLYHSVGLLMDDGSVIVSGGQSDLFEPWFGQSDPPLVGEPPRRFITIPAKERGRNQCPNPDMMYDYDSNPAAGTDRPGLTKSQQRTYEVFYPPYFFQGPRINITLCQDEVQYGQTFRVEIPVFNEITKVRLIRPAAVTHGFDQNQRSVELSFALTGSSVPQPCQNGIQVIAPEGGSTAPPGYYMLFVEGRYYEGGPALPCTKAAWVKLIN